MPNKKIVNEVSSTIYSLPWFVARDEATLPMKAGCGVHQGPRRYAEERTGGYLTREPHRRSRPIRRRRGELFRACEEGNVRRAYDLGQTTVIGCDVHITSLQPSRPLHALVAAPGSKIDHPAQLIGEAVAVNFFAGSHFAAIRLLEVSWDVRM